MMTKAWVFCGMLALVPLFNACSPSSTIPTTSTPVTTPSSTSPNSNNQSLSFRGTYTAANGVLTLAWELNQNVPSPWRPATGTLRGDVLSVRYDAIMQMDDFEDADYVLSEESSKTSRVYVFHDSPSPPQDFTRRSRYELRDDGTFTLHLR